jgi:hypothetical protein
MISKIYKLISSNILLRDLCINRNNHQKPTFHPLGDFLNSALALLGQGLKKSPMVGAVGVGFVAWPFLSTWNPSARAKAAGAPIEVDISKLEEGQLVRVLWRKKPVWIFKRDKTTPI